jgi:hypothetical protein
MSTPIRCLAYSQTWEWDKDWLQYADTPMVPLGCAFWWLDERLHEHHLNLSPDDPMPKFEVVQKAGCEIELHEGLEGGYTLRFTNEGKAPCPPSSLIQHT